MKKEEVLNLSRPQKISLIFVLWVVYFATAKLGLRFALVHTNITALWPPSGIAFTAFFLLGPWVWPAVFLGALTSNWSMGSPIQVAAAIGIGNTLGPYVGAELLRRYKKFHSDFSRMTDVFAFNFFGVLVGPMISATNGILSLHFGHLISPEKILAGWLAWWSGDAMGILVIAPIFMVLHSKKWEKPTVFRVLEATLLIVSFTIAAYFVFTSHELLAYLIYPFGLWAVIRFQQLGIVTLALILAFVSIPLLILRYPMQENWNPELLQLMVFRLQLLLSTASMTGLILAAMRSTEYNLAIEKLDASKEFGNTLIQFMQDGFAMVDQKGIQSDVNPAFCEMTGFSHEELLGKAAPYAYWPPEEYGNIQKKFEAALDGATSNLDLIFMRKNGERFPVIVSPSLVRNKSGEIISCVATIKDITDRKRAEDERIKALGLLQKIASRVPGLVYQYLLRPDGSSCLPFANEYIQHIFRISPEEAREDAAKAFKIVHPDDLEELQISVQHSAQNLTPWVHEFRVTYEDGTVRWLFGNSIPEREQDGSVLWHGFIADITDRRELEESLAKANRNKDLFLATLSHELRTPLTTILTWAQMLRRGKLEPSKVKHAIEMVEKSAKTQSQIIDDLLDISRIQSGKLKLSIEEIDPAKVIRDAIDSTRNLAAQKSIQIEMSVSPSVTLIFADPFRLQQILWNLITNSIKFSEKNEKIWVEMDRLSNPSGDRIRIRVRDQGKGIKAEFLPVIFERFTQLDSSSTRVYGGLGLGLAIVRSLVEMHEGTVEVESQGEGTGATFTVTLPLRPSALSVIPLKKNPTDSEFEFDLQGLKILVVEDDLDAQEVFSFMLQTFGIEVKTAESAKKALDILEHFKPDVLVSDIAMPLEDGYSLMGKIRAADSKIRNVPALALTAYAGPEDVERALLAGFNAHLAKPVHANKLAQILAKLAGRDVFKG